MCLVLFVLNWCELKAPLNVENNGDRRNRKHRPPVVIERHLAQKDTNLAQVNYWILPQETLGGVPREQKMLKGHLPRVIYRQVCHYMKKTYAILSRPSPDIRKGTCPVVVWVGPAMDDVAQIEDVGCRFQAAAIRFRKTLH